VQLRSEIDRISNATNFNGQSLLTGALTGTNGGVTANDMVSGDLLSTGTNAFIASVDVSTAKVQTYTLTSGGAGQLTLTGADLSAQTITGITDMSANETRTFNFSNLGVSFTVTAGAATKTAANLITDLTAAADNTIVVTGSGAARLQVGANTTLNDSMAVSFNDVRATEATGLNLLTGGGVNWSSSATVVASNTAAQAFINQIDTAITTLNTRRSDLGAAQNRLEHTVNSLGVAVENLTASESRIRDADVAALSTQMVSNQILQQAGTAVLSQANQSSQAVLSLLR
jgi:flagellin